MKRAIVWLSIRDNMLTSGMEELLSFLNDDYVTDPELRIIRLENSAIYHLIKYDEGEEPVEEPKKDKYEDVESIVSVDTNDADEYLEEGYVIDNVYAKTVTLIKKKASEMKKMRLSTMDAEYEVIKQDGEWYRRTLSQSPSFKKEVANDD